MSTYVIIPRSQAECNQLRSILHSAGRVPSFKWQDPIRVGKVVVCFGEYFADFHTNVGKATVDELIGAVYLQVNELHSKLKPM